MYSQPEREKQLVVPKSFPALTQPGCLGLSTEGAKLIRQPAYASSLSLEPVRCHPLPSCLQTISSPFSGGKGCPSDHNPLTPGTKSTLSFLQQE